VVLESLLKNCLKINGPLDGEVDNDISAVLQDALQGKHLTFRRNEWREGRDGHELIGVFRVNSVGSVMLLRDRDCFACFKYIIANILRKTQFLSNGRCRAP
jgi:hypothetical protein